MQEVANIGAFSVVSTGETRQQNMIQTPASNISALNARRTPRSEEKTYKANRATVSASYFAKTIYKVNNTSVRSSIETQFGQINNFLQVDFLRFSLSFVYLRKSSVLWSRRPLSKQKQRK